MRAKQFLHPRKVPLKVFILSKESASVAKLDFFFRSSSGALATNSAGNIALELLSQLRTANNQHLLLVRYPYNFFSRR